MKWIVLLIFIGLHFSPIALGCPPCAVMNQYLMEADLVVNGTVVEVGSQYEGNSALKRCRIKIDKIYKGSFASEILSTLIYAKFEIKQGSSLIWVLAEYENGIFFSADLYYRWGSAAGFSFGEFKTHPPVKEIWKVWLRRMQASTTDDICLLETLAQDPDGFVRGFVVVNHHTPSKMLEQFQNDDAFWVQYNLACNKETPVTILLKLAGLGNQFFVSDEAAYAFLSRFPSREEAIAHLSQIIKTKDISTETSIANIIGAINILEKIYNVPREVPLLIELLQSTKQKKSQIALVQKLSEMSSKAKEAVPILISLFPQASLELKRKILSAIKDIGIDNDGVLFLIRILQDSTQDGEIHLRVIWCFGPQIADHSSGVAVFSSLFDKANTQMKIALINAIAKVANPHPNLISLLSTVLSGNDAALKIETAKSLAEVEQPACAFLPLLYQGLKDESSIRYHMIIALGKFGYIDTAQIDALIEALSDKNWQTRVAAVNILGKIGNRAKAAVSKLIQLKDTDLKLARYALKALKNITGKEFTSSLINSSEPDSDENW